MSWYNAYNEYEHCEVTRKGRWVLVRLYNGPDPLTEGRRDYMVPLMVVPAIIAALQRLLSE